MTIVDGDVFLIDQASKRGLWGTCRGEFQPAWEFQRNAYLRGQRELARWLDSVADTKGAPVTFGGKSVEKCVLVKKVDFEK